MNFNFEPTGPPPPPPLYNWTMNCPVYSGPYPGPPPHFTSFPPPPIFMPPNNRQMPRLDMQCNSDSLWIKSWENRVGNTTEKVPVPNNEINKLKVSVLKGKLKTCVAEIKELERLSKCLSVLKKSIPESEWLERRKDIESKKDAVKNLLEEFSDSVVLNAKSVLKKRRKKRLREKLKRVEMRKKVQEAKLHREYEHKRIDMWLEKMKEEVERARREESIKCEADLVLSEVTLRKNEARRMISLLNALSKLRAARVQTLTSRGEYISQQEIETFNQVIEKLKKYWVDQLKGYNLEEQGLRVMLNDAEVERSDIELTLKKKILSDWNTTLFGDKHDKSACDHIEPQNLEELIALRFSWDKYVCTDNMILASSIPLGWVIPSQPSDKNWASLLKK